MISCSTAILLAFVSMPTSFQPATNDKKSTMVSVSGLRSQFKTLTTINAKIADCYKVAYFYSLFGDSIAPLLEELFYDESGDVSSYIAELIFIYWGESSASVIGKNLSGHDPMRLYTTIKLLGDMNAKQYLNQIIMLRNNPDEEVRRAVVETLAKFQDSRAILALLDLVYNDESRSIQEYACLAIATFGNKAKEAGPLIYEHLIKNANTDIGTLSYHGYYEGVIWVDFPCYYQSVALLMIGPSETPNIEAILNSKKYSHIHTSIFWAMIQSNPGPYDISGSRFFSRQTKEHPLANRRDLFVLTQQYSKNGTDLKARKAASSALDIFQGMKEK